MRFPLPSLKISAVTVSAIEHPRQTGLHAQARLAGTAAELQMRPFAGCELLDLLGDHQTFGPCSRPGSPGRAKREPMVNLVLIPAYQFLRQGSIIDELNVLEPSPGALCGCPGFRVASNHDGRAHSQ